MICKQSHGHTHSHAYCYSTWNRRQFICLPYVTVAYQQSKSIFLHWATSAKHISTDHFSTLSMASFFLTSDGIENIRIEKFMGWSQKTLHVRDEIIDKILRFNPLNKFVTVKWVLNDVHFIIRSQQFFFFSIFHFYYSNLVHRIFIQHKWKKRGLRCWSYDLQKKWVHIYIYIRVCNVCRLKTLKVIHSIDINTINCWADNDW